MHSTPSDPVVNGTDLVCYHQGNAFTSGTDKNITVTKLTYVLCRVHGNFEELRLDALSESKAAPGTVLHNRDDHWNLLILLPCNCTNNTKTVTVVAIPQHFNNTATVSFHVMWNCSSCQRGELTTCIPSYIVSSCLKV